MHVTTAGALLPAEFMLQPVSIPGGNDIARHHDDGRPRGGMRFLGYRPAGPSRLYESSGRMRKEPAARGGVVDIYV